MLKVGFDRVACREPLGLEPFDSGLRAELPGAERPQGRTIGINKIAYPAEASLAKADLSRRSFIGEGGLVSPKLHWRRWTCLAEASLAKADRRRWVPATGHSLFSPAPAYVGVVAIVTNSLFAFARYALQKSHTRIGTNETKK
jgi:hypothetical protein